MSGRATTDSGLIVTRAIAWLIWAALWSPGCSLMLRADDMTSDDHVERELALIKLKVRPAQREQVRALVERAGGRVLSDGADCHIVELSSSEAEINALAKALAAQAQMLEIVRSGALAMSRQERILHVVES